MSYSVKGTTIVLTRGDTFVANIGIKNANGTPYIPQQGDTVRFAMKKDYSDASPILEKDIPIETMQLSLEPGDTKSLSFRSYVYDIQLTTKDGVVCTFIKGNINITEEVT